MERCIRFVDNGRTWRDKPSLDSCPGTQPCRAEHAAYHHDKPLTENEWLEEKAAYLLEHLGPDFEGRDPRDSACDCVHRPGNLFDVKIETNRCACRMWSLAFKKAGIRQWKDLPFGTLHGHGGEEEL